jgi:nitrite reductase/ring-hydroxylating ferredoxin subunit
MMHTLIPGTVLCHLNEIPDGGAKEVVFGAGPDCFRVLLLRLGKEAYAYHNCCPHYSLPLNYEPGAFHVYDREYLMCAHHTALFRIEDGECFDGPCAGAHLTRVAIVNDGNTVRVA